jgi:hypothetical protein
MLKFNDKLNYKVLKQYGFEKRTEYVYALTLFDCEDVPKHDMEGAVEILVFTKDITWCGQKKNDVILWTNYLATADENEVMRETDDSIPIDILFDLIVDGIIVKEK